MNYPYNNLIQASHMNQKHNKFHDSAKVQMPYKSKNFLNLRSKWYKKLEKTGFDDIELYQDCKGNFDNSFLKYQQVNLKYNMSYETYLIHFNHYQNLRKFSCSHQFKLYFVPTPAKSVRMLRKITELHANGHSVRYISTHLRRYWKQPATKRGRAGKAYSHFWVFNKIKLIKSALYKYISAEEAKQQDLFSIEDFMESNRS